MLVPQQPLNVMVRRQAQEMAAAEYASGTCTYCLDGEPIDEGEISELVECRAYELIDTRGLWRPNPLPRGTQRDQEG